MSLASPFPCFGALLSSWLTPCVYKQTLGNRQGKQHLHAGAAMRAQGQARRLLALSVPWGAGAVCQGPLAPWLTHISVWYSTACPP